MNKYLCLCLLIFTSFSSQSQNKKNYLESLSYDELKEVFFKNEGKIQIQKKYAKAFLNKATNGKFFSLDGYFTLFIILSKYTIFLLSSYNKE